MLRDELSYINFELQDSFCGETDLKIPWEKK